MTGFLLNERRPISILLRFLTGFTGFFYTIVDCERKSQLVYWVLLGFFCFFLTVHLWTASAYDPAVVLFLDPVAAVIGAPVAVPSTTIQRRRRRRRRCVCACVCVCVCVSCCHRSYDYDHHYFLNSVFFSSSISAWTTDVIDDRPVLIVVVVVVVVVVFAVGRSTRSSS